MTWLFYILSSISLIICAQLLGFRVLSEFLEELVANKESIWKVELSLAWLPHEVVLLLIVLFNLNRLFDQLVRRNDLVGRWYLVHWCFLHGYYRRLVGLIFFHLMLLLAFAVLGNFLETTERNAADHVRPASVVLHAHLLWFVLVKLYWAGQFGILKFLAHILIWDLSRLRPTAETHSCLALRLYFHGLAAWFNLRLHAHPLLFRNATIIMED